MALTLNLSKESPDCATDSESRNDLVAFVSGLLLGNNPDIRNWFSMFIKSGQRVSIVRLFLSLKISKSMTRKCPIQNAHDFEMRHLIG